MSPRTVLITGVSSGLGRILARRLAAAGWRVFGTSRGAPDGPLEGVTEGVTMCRLDVTDDESVARCVGEVLRSCGGVLDALVNNAGRLDEGPLEEFSAAELHAVFDANLFGVARMVSAVLPSMRARSRGRIVNVSSLAGLMPLPFLGAYCASKHALESYTESLRYEVRPLGIHVSLVEPGHFRSRMATAKVRKLGGIADYEPQRERMYAQVDRDEGAAPDGDAVAARLVRILESSRPRLRYPFGQYSVNYYLRGITPEWAWEFGLRRSFRLDP